MSIPRILCFGEILWDHLPHGRFLGGAPVNVAYHLKKLGGCPLPVTAVGGDEAGVEILRRLEQWGVDTRFVGRVPDKASGQVRVHLSRADQPTYEIVQDVAWDAIPDSPELEGEARTAQAVVFGSLAQRSASNRALLDKLLRTAVGLKVFDVNLRPPFVDETGILARARQSHLIKLNDQELDQLLRSERRDLSLEAKARRFAQVVDCPQICVTAGRLGAGWLRAGVWTWADARPVDDESADTVGAGDAFLAALVASLLIHPELSSETILQRACRLAEFVARSPGATPEYDVEMIFKTDLH